MAEIHITVPENPDVFITKPGENQYIHVIDNLFSDSAVDALSANQGRILKDMVNGKVDEEAGKGLSTNDYTDVEKEKLAGIEAGAQVNDVASVAGKTGAVTLDKADVGLGNVDNTSDVNKPISTATQSALGTKVDKVTGKGLSTNDYTTEEKTKLAGIENNANNYMHPANHPASMIVQDAANRFVSDTEKAAWNGKLDTGNIKAGANVSVSVNGNDVTISSTGGGGAEVGIVDNLESTSTTDALSANQGRVLKGEVDGKAAASHTHTKTQITDFAHTHGKSDITDFAHTHTKTDITDFPASMTPTAHASTATTYGVGTATQYGHVKLANNLTTAATGSALDARQGKVLQDSKLEAADIVAGDNVEVDTSGGTVTISASGGGQKGSAVYRETGTWYCPPGVTKVTVIAIGGGGGGGSRNGPDFTKGGGGGGGGNIRLYENVSVTPGTTYDVVVGAGGFGGNSSSQDGKSGGTSYFRSTSYGATGGTGGAVGTSSAIGAGGNGQAGGGGGGTAAANGGNGYTGADGSGALGGDGSGQPISADMIAKTTGGQYALCNGGKSAGHGISSGSVNEEAPNSVGCGGKGALTVTNSQTISGQTGGDGGVYIYYEVE